MSVSPSFRTFVLEQLGRVVAGVRGRAMFGGVGIYAGDLFFALIDDDTWVEAVRHLPPILSVEVTAWSG